VADGLGGGVGVGDGVAKGLGGGVGAGVEDGVADELGVGAGVGVGDGVADELGVGGVSFSTSCDASLSDTIAPGSSLSQDAESLIDAGTFVLLPLSGLSPKAVIIPIIRKHTVRTAPIPTSVLLLFFPRCKKGKRLPTEFQILSANPITAPQRVHLLPVH